MKRAFDFVVAVLACAMLLPLFLVIAFLVRMRLGSPVVFRQTRPGKDQEFFEMMKFRSMTDDRDENGELLDDGQRLTSFGKRLRSSSLDELPALWNVIVGDMSLVGPRPLLVEYLDHYTDTQNRRHEVRPGITGWAQVNGRNALSWEQKFEFDVWYVDNRSLLLDMRILVMTIAKVFRKEGIAHANEATMPRFSGQRTASTERENPE